MKIKTIFFIATVFICTGLFGQDSSKKKIKEFYMTLAGISPLSVQLKYKKQIGKKTFFKVGLIDLGAYASRQTSGDPFQFPVSSAGYSGGLEFGIERRKIISDRFTFFHGMSLNYSYSASENRDFDPAKVDQKYFQQTHKGGIPYSLGLLFNITSNILISAEINPAIYYTYSEAKNGSSPYSAKQNALNFGFNNRVGLISFVYRL